MTKLLHTFDGIFSRKIEENILVELLSASLSKDCSAKIGDNGNRIRTTKNNSYSDVVNFRATESDRLDEVIVRPLGQPFILLII